mgnify:CR=1 FL=1
MMDALRFIFSSFWIWLGFTTLVAVVLKYLVDAIKAIRNTRNVKIYTFENGNRTVEIENASRRCRRHRHVFRPIRIKVIFSE